MEQDVKKDALKQNPDAFQDPVCGMQVDPSSALVHELDGGKHYFCSEGCRDKFIQSLPRDGNRESYDLVIIGGGPAGLTAAVYAAQLRMSAVLVTTNMGGQAIDSTKVKNYMGYDFITGPELVEKFKSQFVGVNYIDHHLGTVDRIKSLDDGTYRSLMSDGQVIASKAVLLATGMTRRTLEVPGAEEYLRRGVYYRNIHDYSAVQAEQVAVVGGGNSAMQSVEKLLPIARKIHVVSDMKLTADRAVLERLVDSPRVVLHEGYKVSSIEGEHGVERIRIRSLSSDDEVELQVSGVFVNIGLKANAALVAHLVKLNDRGEVMIEKNCSTNREGLYAAGDVTDAYGKRIIIAAGEGAKAATAIRKYLQKRKQATTDG